MGETVTENGKLFPMSLTTLISVLGFMFLLVFVLIFMSGTDPQKQLKKIVQEYSFKGRVSKKYIDHKSSGDIMFVLNSGSTYPVHSSTLYEDAEIGDSIDKKICGIMF